MIDTETMRERPRPAFTKERFYVDHMMKHGMALYRRHVSRYKWAASHLTSEMEVLDAGCGSGYGDYILLNNCLKMTSIDQSGEAIEYATYKAESLNEKRIKYGVSTLQDYMASPSKSHAIVCIEVIEHLSEENQRAFMAGMKNAFFKKEDALLLITTPIRKEDKWTEYHEHEFTKSEFQNFLSTYFQDVHFEDQKKWDIPLLGVCRGVR